MDGYPTTMSVRNMGQLLGLQKVDSYWLVHKGFFETILIGGKMRVVTESFEHWYAGQVKYRKVNGDPPGERLKKESYSARDIAEMLQINEQYVYEVMEKAGIKPVIVDYWKRFPKAAFDAWYAGQTRFRNAEDRQRDAEAEKASMSMPEMARLLDVPRRSVYSILNSRRGREILDVIVIADRKRVTRESFDRWYAGQAEYLKPEDRIHHPDAKDRHYSDCLTGKNVKHRKKKKKVTVEVTSANPDYLTLQEAAVLAEVDIRTVQKWLRNGKFPMLKISAKTTRIPKDPFIIYLKQRI